MTTVGQHTLLGLELLGTAAFGGGTLRDLLIDRRPFIWVEHQSVLLGTLLLCLACNEIPSLFRDHRPYAVCAALGQFGLLLLAGM